MNYELEKDIWTDADFENMGWHDCRIYKIRLGLDLELDIDYIFKWNQPDLEGLPFTFWLAPATLVFRRPKQVTFDLDIAFEDVGEIDSIERSVGDEGISWTIDTQKGEIQLLSSGFEQFIRQKPTYQFGQTISYFDRYGYSVERTTNQNNPNLLKDDYLNRRKKDFDNYDSFKRKHLLKLEKETLSNLKDNNKINLKECLLKERELKKMIADIDLLLKDTIFESWGSF